MRNQHSGYFHTLYTWRLHAEQYTAQNNVMILVFYRKSNLKPIYFNLLCENVQNIFVIISACKCGRRLWCKYTTNVLLWHLYSLGGLKDVKENEYQRHIYFYDSLVTILVNTYAGVKSVFTSGYVWSGQHKRTILQALHNCQTHVSCQLNHKGQNICIFMHTITGMIFLFLNYCQSLQMNHTMWDNYKECSSSTAKKGSTCTRKEQKRDNFEVVHFFDSLSPFTNNCTMFDKI